MPLTKKDAKLMAGLMHEYGSEKKAKEVFYAGAQKGTFGPDMKKRHGAAAHRKKMGK